MTVRTILQQCQFYLHQNCRPLFTLAYSLITPVRTFFVLNHGYGHFRSVRKMACLDADHRPIPWYSYPALEFLKQLNFSDKNVFEYGSGNSTLYWSSVAAQVTSVESNEEWWKKISTQAPPNANIILEKNLDKYVTKIAERLDAYDVIVVDGDRRLSAARIAPAHLKPGGLVILDNADSYPKSARVLRDAGLIQVDMTGFGPINGYTWTTSFFFHRAFDFASREAHQPAFGTGSLRILAVES